MDHVAVKDDSIPDFSDDFLPEDAIPDDLLLSSDSLDLKEWISEDESDSEPLAKRSIIS